MTVPTLTTINSIIEEDFAIIPNTETTTINSILRQNRNQDLDKTNEELAQPEFSIDVVEEPKGIIHKPRGQYFLFGPILDYFWSRFGPFMRILSGQF